jgi:molecular chaperone Hsp33
MSASDTGPPREQGGRGDSLLRFLFEDAGVRGEHVHLDASWQAVLDTHPYPPEVRALLGQALAAVALLSATIKFRGSLILQIQSEGPLTLLVAQGTHERRVRGLARWQGPVPQGDLAEAFGEGRVVLTLDRRRGEPYQGIVPLEGPDLAAVLERYFGQSEQLPTRLWLAADGARAAGLLIQRLPGESVQDEDWARIAMLADTLTSGELLGLHPEDLLYRLFNEERVRVFDAEPLAFRCTCSRARIEETLRALGREEVGELVRESGPVEVDCEFCNRRYSFDAVDVEALFAAAEPVAASPSRH